MTHPVPGAVQTAAAPLAQQACPRSPHASQVPVTQVLAVQLRPCAQQACPRPPQFTHCAEGAQRPPRQQLPAPHTLPVQHAWPSPPHALQRLVPSQTVSALHTPPAQHI